MISRENVLEQLMKHFPVDEPAEMEDFLEVGRDGWRDLEDEQTGAIRLQPLNLNYPARSFSRSEILGMWRLAAHVARYG